MTTQELTDKELIDWAIKNKRVDILVEHKWGFKLSPGQCDIVRKIAFLEVKKLSISAMTRYGKTQCVAFGIALLLDFDVPAKIAFLGPKEEQAGIIRQYLAELITMDKSLLSKAQLFATGADRLGKEASRKRMTFNTGAEYRVFSGEGDADRLMGFGCVPPHAKIITNQGVMTAENVWKTKKKLLIYSYNHTTEKCEFQSIKYKVINPPRKLIRITHDSGRFIVTDNHPVYVDGVGFVKAHSLQVNQKLFKCDCFHTNYGNSKMSSVRKPIPKTAKPCSKSKACVLFSCLQSKACKQKSYNQKMSFLWKRIQTPFKSDNLLFNKVQRHSKKSNAKEKGRNRMSILWEKIQSYSCKEGFSILFKSLCKQSTWRKNIIKEESCMERRDRKFTLGSRIQQEIKSTDKRTRWTQMFFMWKNRICSNTPHRLQQEEQQRRKPCDIMCELPLQNQLPKRDVEKVIIRRIEELPAEKETYNFEVEQNHNYFVDGILTHNCDILIRDEACLINRAAFTKSSRMLGDNPESAVEIELYNPWDTDNKAYEHTLDPEWEVIRIDWKQAVKEGRTTQKFVDQQRRDLLPLEFTVLYESQFPEQSEDSIISMAWVKDAEQTKFNFLETQTKLRQKIKELEKKRTQMAETEYQIMMKPLMEELNKYCNIVACDPAEQGLDETVIIWGIEYENRFQVVGTYSEPKSEPMRVVGKMVDIAISFIPKNVRGKINIDRIGIGSGPLSRLKEVIFTEMQLKNIRVCGCHYGERAMKKDIFHNKKAENWFRLADLLREGMMDIPEHHKIRRQLVSEKTERTSSNKKIVKDPEEKSPDWGDALVYLVWKDKSGLAYGFA